MTVSSIIPVNNYAGNGSTKSFDFDFLIESTNELLVTHISENEVSTVLKYGIDYSIAEVGNVNGSYIIFPLLGSSFGILKNTETISLSLNLEIKQESKFENSSYLNLSVLEWTFDYIIRILQMLNRKIDRCVKVKEGLSETPDNIINTIAVLQDQCQKNAIIAEQYAQEAKAVIEENVSWGKIYGEIENQNDLKTVLSSKADISLCDEIVWNKVYQCNAVETGIVNSDSEIYLDILNYAHSTFDKSKFTVVGTPTITDDGIASGFSLSNYLKINYTDFVDNDFEFTIEFTLNSNALQGIFQSKIGGNAVGFRVWVEANLLYTSLFGNGQQVWYSFITSALTDTKYTYTLKKSGNIYTEELVYGDKKATKSHTSDVVMDIDTNGMYLGRDFQKPLLGVVDLKSFTIWSNGQPVFNGNITGTDTYTINEEETQIPYTLSKTGSKIVDVYYRELIQGLYQEQGYAPYYTIDEQNQNFTLPMGEVYGMIERKLDAKKTPHVIETYNDGQNWYRIWSDGWIEQGGYIGQITSGTLTFLQPFTNTNYSVLCTPRDVSSPPRVTVWNNATVANIQYSTTVQSGQSIGAGYTSSSWYAFGY